MCYNDVRGNRILGGSRRLLDDLGLADPSEADARLDELRGQGETFLFVGVNDRSRGEARGGGSASASNSGG